MANDNVALNVAVTDDVALNVAKSLFGGSWWCGTLFLKNLLICLLSDGVSNVVKRWILNFQQHEKIIRLSGLEPLSFPRDKATTVWAS